MKPFMPGRLFAKIYLTLLASLLAVALASAALFLLSHRAEDRGWQARRDAFIAAMLPAEAPLEETRVVLERLAAAFEADAAIFDPEGGLIASVGEMLPFTLPREENGSRRREDKELLVARLPDGRVVVARLETFSGPPTGIAIWLAVIAAATALAAWPVVRHLTGRLERLRRGVEDWGGGELALRVPVEGKDEVAAVAASFNVAATQIAALVEAHRTLLANASHELRSPLARLRMAVDLYEKEPDETLKREIVRNLGELDELVEEILLASRLDHIGQAAPSDEVDLLALAAEEAARFGIEVSGEPAIVDGDARLLARLIGNLLQNALRHGAPPVSVEVGRAGAMVELAIRDHGAGIAEAEWSRVFEPFYRPAGQSEATGGWGLGLALVRQIATHHGGGVRLEAPAGGGTRFVAALPASHSRS